MDQVGAVIVEQDLGLAPSTIGDLRALCKQLPLESSLALLAYLAGRVEQCGNEPIKQLAVAEWFFGPCPLMSRYRAFVLQNPGRVPFSAQGLYSLTRILIEVAREAPLVEELRSSERATLAAAVVASSALTYRGLDLDGEDPEAEILAFEMQMGNYYHRSLWREPMVRQHRLYRLGTNVADLPPGGARLKEWTEASGLTYEDQFELGFVLGAVANCWDADRSAVVPAELVKKVLDGLGLSDRSKEALGLLVADREAYIDGFADLRASGPRYTWELRPFKSKPFLRLADGALLLLGRPLLVSWLSHGFHYRALDHARNAAGKLVPSQASHDYTAFVGDIMEKYCVAIAFEALGGAAKVWPEQPYGRGNGSKTSDVAVRVGNDLFLFEVNARMLAADPAIGGEASATADELQKLVVGKINQLGGCISALFTGKAHLPGSEMDTVKRVWPVVVAGGHLWQTRSLWSHLDAARDAEKCQSLYDARVQPVQLVDVDDYEVLLALVQSGCDLRTIMERKTDSRWRHRDFAVWLNQDKSAPSNKIRLASSENHWQGMVEAVTGKFHEAPEMGLPQADSTADETGP